MNHRRRTLAALVVAGIAVTACGSDDATDSADTTAATTETTAAEQSTATTVADAPTDGATITIEGFAFGGVTEVPVGTTVVVTNNDGAEHTWTAVDGSFHSGSLGQGDSFEFTFTEAGSFEYRCNIHPAMTGTITVTG